MKQTIICIVGNSGSGKTTMSKYLEKHGIPSIVSCTTRKRRQDETHGVEHWFIGRDEVPPKGKMLAHTKFGGFDYWITSGCVPDSPISTYVVDEKGLMQLMEDHSDCYRIVPVLVKRDPEKCVSVVGKERVKRDKCRIRIDEQTYETIIDNNGTIDEFYNEIEKFEQQIEEKYGSNRK